MQDLIILISRLNVTRLLTGDEAERAEAAAQITGALAAAKLLLHPVSFVNLVNAVDLDEPTVADLLDRITPQPEPAINL